MSIARFERRQAPLAPRRVFYTRVARSALLSLALIGATLALGTAGYLAFTDLKAIEAFHQAAMLLSGMGPVHAEAVKTTSAIVFESLYAIFCGVMLLAVTALMLAPVVHRLLHRFHLEGTKQ